MRRTQWMVGLAAAIILATAGGPAWAQSPALELLRYVPAEVELVVGVNVRDVASSASFAAFRQRLDKENRLNALVTIVERLTGVNLLQDVEAVVLATELRKDAPAAVIVRGTWDVPNLVELLALNPTYKKQTLQGVDLHSWTDEKSGKANNAAFLATDVVVFGERIEAVQRVLETAGNADQALVNAAKLKGLSGISTPASVFAVAFRPAGNPEVLDNPVLARLVSVTLRGQLDGDQLTAWGVLESEDEQSALLYADLINGLIALGKLNDNTSVSWQAELRQEGSRVLATLSASTPSLIDLMERQQLAKAAQATP